MEKKDYIPGSDEGFDILQNNILQSAIQNSGTWMIPQPMIEALAPLRTRWINALTVCHNPATHTPAATQEKNDAKKEYISALRPFIQGQLMHNPNVSDADRRSMGLPVYDRTPTPVQPIGTRPELTIDFSQVLRHTIQARNEGSKKYVRPKNAIGFELWQHIGGHTEPSYDSMQLIELATRSPHMVEYTAASRGQMIWYAARWVNSHGAKGPWSEITGAVVG